MAPVFSGRDVEEWRAVNKTHGVHQNRNRTNARPRFVDAPFRCVRIGEVAGDAAYARLRLQAGKTGFVPVEGNDTTAMVT